MIERSKAISLLSDEDFYEEASYRLCLAERAGQRELALVGDARNRMRGGCKHRSTLSYIGITKGPALS